MQIREYPRLRRKRWGWPLPSWGLWLLVVGLVSLLLWVVLDDTVWQYVLYPDAPAVDVE